MCLKRFNWKVVDHVSDINLTYTEHARRYLLNEGLRPEMVIKTGSPMKEVLEHYWEHIELSSALELLDVRAGEYFLVSAHREENVDNEDNFRSLLLSLNAIAARFELPIIFSTHPRTRKKLEEKPICELNSRIRFLKPMGFFEYVKLQTKASCVISDSGTITEESSILTSLGHYSPGARTSRGDGRGDINYVWGPGGSSARSH